MTLYRLVLFGHVASVTLLFAALALEWLSLSRLAKSTSYEQAREWSTIWGLLLPLGMPGILVVLTSGIYLATAVGAWTLGWVKVAIPTLVLVAIAGAIVGPRRNRLRTAIAEGVGALPRHLLLQLRHPLFVASLRTRAALLISLVFAMTARPEPALPAIAAFALLGVVGSLPAWTSARVSRTSP
jgi:hypothetical protein